MTPINRRWLFALLVATHLAGGIGVWVSRWTRPETKCDLASALEPATDTSPKLKWKQ
jgi:hypothetical protein